MFRRDVSAPLSRKPLAVLGPLGAALVVGACTRASGDATAGPDRRAGATQITRNACGSCHVIPGIEEAEGRVGPSLRHFASRQMIAGRLANTPTNLQRWLKSPQSIKPGDVMPDEGLTDAQARDVAAYLGRLK